jgi:hypothetical protein
MSSLLTCLGASCWIQWVASDRGAPRERGDKEVATGRARFKTELVVAETPYASAVVPYASAVVMFSKMAVIP